MGASSSVKERPEPCWVVQDGYLVSWNLSLPLYATGVEGGLGPLRLEVPSVQPHPRGVVPGMERSDGCGDTARANFFIGCSRGERAILCGQTVTTASFGYAGGEDECTPRYVVPALCHFGAAFGRYSSPESRFPIE